MARPNAIHLGLADLESRGQIHQLVTQSVDGLHQGGVPRRVTDLPGCIDRVDCLGCGLGLPRGRMQELLALLNPGHPGVEVRAAPDRDAHLYLPIAILNRGRTRAVALVTSELDVDCAVTLATLQGRADLKVRSS